MQGEWRYSRSRLDDIVFALQVNVATPGVSTL
jgi:hypothetical protein